MLRMADHNINQDQYEENMTDWMKALSDHSINVGFSKKATSRLVQLERLANSGLPTYKFHFFSLSSLFSDNGFDQRLVEVYESHEGNVVARVISKDGLVRITSIGKSLEDNLAFFRSKLISKLGLKLSYSLNDINLSDYVLVVNEYDPAKYSGVIISDKDRLIIEIVEDDNLEKLCHGRVIPWTAEFKEELPYQFRRMKYYDFRLNDSEKESFVKKLMWQVVKSISKEEPSSGNIPNYIPKLGYFEFVISKKDGKLRFIDYNPDFSKLD